MAKRNSTKTATKEAYSASEPRIQTYSQWTGVNVKEAPLGWNPQDDGHNQTDLMPNYLVVQNNAATTFNKTVETRPDTQLIAVPPAGKKFTGVACLEQERLIMAMDDASLAWHDLDSDVASWTKIPVTDPDGGPPSPWTSIGYYASTLISFTEAHECFEGSLSSLDSTGVSSHPFIPDPTIAPSLTPIGGLETGDVTRISVCYVYTNIFGSTLRSAWATIMVNKNPVEWSAAAYLRCVGLAPLDVGVTGVDLYCTLDENQDAIFIGHVTLTNGGAWQYNWLGALSDTSAWTNVSLTLPSENTTKGVNAAYMHHHDGRLYFWGGDEPYRLWIGGNPGNELSVARGVGGAFVDIEPGTGTEVKGTLKFKTYNGASIVTAMCGNPNTGNVKRFNLLETNITVTNEIASKGYMTEEVSNVVGCNSHWGSGVWADGLYSVSRYGLALTTQAMESSNQLRVQYVSDSIEPVFSWRLAEKMNNARMICIKDVIYIVLAENDQPPDDGTIPGLDHVVLCYDIAVKAWYTFTIETDEKILNIISLDSEKHWEGIGIITEDAIWCITTTQRQPSVAPEFDMLIETGEMAIRQPLQETAYLAQLEMRFDYFIGELDVVVEGVDYYGRHVTFEKHIAHDTVIRDLPEWMRIDCLLESWRMTMKGKARFRLTHIHAKVYQQSRKINLVYGFDDRASYMNRHGGVTDIHHRIDSYNNLREAIIP